MGIQINGNTNNINAGIGSLSIEDIRELDITGIATAANFKTGVSNLHSLGLTLSGGQLDVGSNIKVGTAGVITATTFVGNLTGTATQVSLASQSSDTDCYPVFALDATGNQTLHTKSNRLSFNSATGALSATSFVGDGSNLTGISAGTSLSGSTNNTVCTVTGANAIQGETKLTFDSTTTQLKITRDDDSNSGFYVFHNDGSECARLVNKGSGHEGALLLQDGGTPTVYFDGETGSRSYINTGAGLAIGTQNLVSGRSDNVLHLHKASSGTADGPTIYFTNQQTGVTGSDGFTVGLNDAQSPYLWNRENTATRFGTNNAERLRITSSGELWVGTTSGVSNGGYGGISLNGSSGSLLSLMQNGTEYLRLFGDSNPAIQFAGVLRLFSGVSGGSAIWGISPNGTTTGANSVTFNLKSTIQHTVGVMAVSSSYNSGDLYIRIDNIYNLAGNAWWTFGLWIMTNQTVGTLAGHHSYMIHCVMTGLGSWSGLSANNIQGSGAANVSVSQHGTNFVELRVDVHDSSRGPCTVLCNGGTFDPPRISFH